MRILLPTLSLLSCIAIACGGAERAKTLDAAGGQKITKEFYPDGTIKTVTRLHPDGGLPGILYLTANGTPTYADSEILTRRMLCDGRGR